MNTPKQSSIKADPMAIIKLLKDENGNDPKGLPPIHKWNPEFCGDINMEIKRNGQWFYMGTPIGRAPLVKLFSTILRREDDDFYYLVTPVEKVRIKVEDAPLVVVSVDVALEEGVQYLKFTTLTGDVVVAGDEHPLWVEYHAEEPSPYIHIRDRLHALINRNVFYELVELGEVESRESGDVLIIKSAGQRFEIGRL